MSDTHRTTPRYVIRRAVTEHGNLWHVIDTDTDLSYGCFAHDSAKRIAARLNGDDHSAPFVSDCRACDGTGLLDHYYRYADDPCPACNGTGKTSA